MTSPLSSETIEAAPSEAMGQPRRRPVPPALANHETRRTPRADVASSREAELDATVPPRTVDGGGHAGRSDLLLYLMLTALVAAAWQIGEMGLIKPDEDISYWIGVAGGSCMAALFVYPLRKYTRFMQGWGKVKFWFWAHLALGICGPWLILVHAQFRIGSLNAGVALISMCIVVVSGVIGRFIYVRIHRGLHGERTSLHQLRQRAGLVESEARSRLHFCPAAESRLQAFERRVLLAQPEWTTHLRHVVLLPVQQWITYLRCVRDLRQPLHEMALTRGWQAAELRRRKRRARRLVDQYLNAVVRVAQYSAYERVFALWHMAHLPFIYLLVISAAVHVVAVHAY